MGPWHILVCFVRCVSEVFADNVELDYYHSERPDTKLLTVDGLTEGRYDTN